MKLIWRTAYKYTDGIEHTLRVNDHAAWKSSAQQKHVLYWILQQKTLLFKRAVPLEPQLLLARLALLFETLTSTTVLVLY
jgi:hypothetical protein